MSISLSKDIKIIPGVLAASGDALDLNGVILTNSAYAPVGTLSTFTDDDDVGTYYGTAATEYSMAEIYLQGYTNCTSLPGTLYFWGYNTTDVSAWLRSASMSSMTVSALKLLSGSLTLTVDNGTSITGAIDLSSVTSFAGAAAAIQTALGDTVSVAYDTTVTAFIISSATTGANSAITYASGDLATSLLLTSATGAVISQGADAITDPTDSFTALIAATDDWATFTTSFECSVSQHLLFAEWCSNKSDRYAYVGWSNDGTETVSGSTETMAYQIDEVYSYGGTIPVYGDQTHAASVMGWAAALNFDQENGRNSLKYTQLDGLLAQASTDAEWTALEANGYNFYGQYGANNIAEKYWAPGSITGDYLWADAYFGQIWLNANLQSAILTGFLDKTNLPYNTTGKATVESWCSDVIAQFKTWGGISTGTSLDSSQILKIKSIVGTDISTTLTNTGYYMYIGSFTATQRMDRESVVVYLWYTDGGQIQSLTLNSVEVQ
ncbi:DUF3383 domain-containing protein [Serratia sp. M24T3]|uniref:DUF3383 domain-containing protein n=1 Tax=Serratia sp. M24T3 TaxID=932213 RepID=UPI00025B8F3B|nr:DUF3383 domain-containing protein [Serratia sp. M24T3]EIC83985.1 hypothetical protein SPM24T3_13750 [Serratia sp. M24T3]